MRQVIRKWFWAWEFDKEEQWLGDMAAQGKALVSARYITYEFEDSQPGEYAVRLEMMADAPDSPEGKALLLKWGLPTHLRGVGNCILGYPAGSHPAPAPRKDGRILKID